MPRGDHRLRRRLVRWLALVLGVAVLAALLLLHFADMGSELTPEQEACVRRFTYVAPSGEVAVIAAGVPDAPRVILVHGTPGSAADFADLLLDPPPGVELLAVDRPGFGRSEPRDALPSLQAQADALLPLLEERGGRWPVLVGHSLGAPIVAQLAADHPERVGGLLLLAGALDPGLEEWHWYNRAATLLGPVLARPLRNSNDELRPLPEQLRALGGELARIRCPVVVVHGRKDQLVPFANVDYMRRMLTGAAPLRVVELPDGDHFLPWDAVATVREALASLIGS
jgi:pimeloyl-ACP methyl ester carboxylesterase